MHGKFTKGNQRLRLKDQKIRSTVKRNTSTHQETPVSDEIHRGIRLHFYLSSFFNFFFLFNNLTPCLFQDLWLWLFLWYSITNKLFLSKNLLLSILLSDSPLSTCTFLQLYWPDHLNCVFKGFEIQLYLF